MWHSAHLNFSIFHQHRWVFLYFQFRVVKNQSCQVTNWLDFISFQESRYVSGVGFKIAWNQGHLDDYLITGLAGLVLVFLNYSLAPCCGSFVECLPLIWCIWWWGGETAAAPLLSLLSVVSDLCQKVSFCTNIAIIQTCPHIQSLQQTMILSTKPVSTPVFMIAVQCVKMWSQTLFFSSSVNLSTTVLLRP